MIPVPLFYLKFLDWICRAAFRNFKQAALDLLTLALHYSWAKQAGETRVLGPERSFQAAGALEMWWFSHRDGRNLEALPAPAWRGN